MPVSHRKKQTEIFWKKGSGKSAMNSVQFEQDVTQFCRKSSSLVKTGQEMATNCKMITTNLFLFGNNKLRNTYGDDREMPSEKKITSTPGTLLFPMLAYRPMIF